MASNWFHHGLAMCLDGTIDLDAASELKVMLMQSSYSFDPDADHVSDISASELSCTGYTGGFGGAGRHVLSNVTITADDTNDYTVVDADNPAVWSGLGTGQTCSCAVVIAENTADSDSHPIFMVDITDFSTDGDFTLQFAAGGIARFKHPA